jgi:transcriptional regulator with XRE-family HTH domain
MRYNRYNEDRKEDKMSAKEIAEKAGCSIAWVYKLAKELGRYPTVDEIKERKGKIGRPKKYETKEGD